MQEPTRPDLPRWRKNLLIVSPVQVTLIAGILVSLTYAAPIAVAQHTPNMPETIAFMLGYSIPLAFPVCGAIFIACIGWNSLIGWGRQR